MFRSTIMGSVSQCSFKKLYTYSFQGPVYQCLEISLRKMLKQVSLLPNKIRHLEVCNTLRKLRFNKISDKVRRKIVRNVRASVKSIQVQVV